MESQARHRAFILDHVRSGGLTIDEAARVLGLSTRQVERLLARYAGDPADLGHRNRGRVPANRTDPELRRRIVELARTTYADVNRAHLAELLAEREGLAVAARTLRRILAEADIAPVRRRRPPRHRRRRERMSQAGLLLQVDGSRHRWLEDRGPQLTLHGGIDDATGTVTGGLFREQEDAAGYFAVFAQTTATYGLPVATYSDRHGIFVREPARPATISEQLTGRRTFTQVGRALDAVGIAWIGARSPQAKGRIERLWGTLQDRLVVELRLAGASTLGEANGILATYLARHNARFAVAPADPVPAWRALPEDLTAEAIFCFHYPRRVARDATVSWGREALALPRRSDGRSWAGRSVVLQERLDGSLWVSHGGEACRVETAPPTTGQLRARQLSRWAEGRPDLPAELDAIAIEATIDPVADDPSRGSSKPRPDHPWRRPNKHKR